MHSLAPLAETGSRAGWAGKPLTESLASFSILALGLFGLPALAQAQDSQPKPERKSKVDEEAKPERRRPSLRDRFRRFRRQWQREFGIERDLAFGQVRGVLGKAPPPPDWTPRSAGKGKLVKGPGGIPILYLNGTPAEIGRQHGTLLKNEIQALRAYVRAFVGPRRLAKARRRAADLFQEHVPQRYLDEAESLAAAADMPLDELLFAQWFTDLYRNAACSTVAAPKSAAGAPFLARNLDFPTLGYLQRYSIVTVVRPTGQEPFVSITWPGLIGVLSAQNRGVALSVLVVHDAEGARSGLPFMLALRKAIEEASTCEGVEKVLRKTPLTVTNNLALVDSTGEARVIELDPAGLESLSSRERALTTTNHFQSPFKRTERLSFSFLSSQNRLRALRRACPANTPAPTVKAARKALADASVSFTAQSMVFHPKQGEVEVAFVKRGPAAKGEFVRLEPKWLLGAE